ncbi:MAG: GTP cyclohydrolase I FolE [Saprospiraceae bacterium]
MSYEFEERYSEEKTKRIAELTEETLRLLGEDPSREGLLKTPERSAKAMQFLTKGYNEDPAAILKSALFTEEYSDMVVVKNIEFYSLCEHHMLPFYGQAHVAYIPNGKIVGLSKIPRLIDVFARRLQVQERLTREVLDTIQEVLKPQGAAIVIEARHMCMMMRGAQKQASLTTTSAFSGQFEEHQTRSEFLKLISSDLHR